MCVPVLFDYCILHVQDQQYIFLDNQHLNARSEVQHSVDL